jgi:hypothetical protein
LHSEPNPGGLWFLGGPLGSVRVGVGVGPRGPFKKSQFPCIPRKFSLCTLGCLLHHRG